MKHRRSRPESGRSRSPRWRKWTFRRSQIPPRRIKLQASGHLGRSIAPPPRASHDPADQAARRNPHSPRPRAAASSPGGFRTPALSPVRTPSHGPASETLHTSGTWVQCRKRTLHASRSQVGSRLPLPKGHLWNSSESELAILQILRPIQPHIVRHALSRCVRRVEPPKRQKCGSGILRPQRVRVFQ